MYLDSVNVTDSPTRTPSVTETRGKGVMGWAEISPTVTITKSRSDVLMVLDIDYQQFSLS